MSLVETTLVANIKRFRSMSGLTQREVGTRLFGASEGNSPANIMSKIEKGERVVSAAELYELSVVFGCGMDSLMGVTESPDPLAGRLRVAVEEAIESVMGGAA